MQQEVAAKEQQAVRLQETMVARTKVCLHCSSMSLSLLPTGCLILDEMKVPEQPDTVVHLSRQLSCCLHGACLVPSALWSACPEGDLSLAAG